MDETVRIFAKKVMQGNHFAIRRQLLVGAYQKKCFQSGLEFGKIIVRLIALLLVGPGKKG
jgi:hypothetical protein